MGFATAILTPLALMLPAPGGAVAIADQSAVDPSSTAAPPQAGQTAAELPVKFEPPGWSMHIVVQQYEPDAAQQVRIEQRMTIRITPRSDTSQRNMFAELPNQAIGPRFVERKIGECVKVSRISGVQSDIGNRLLLFMSDQRIISAMLERSCRSRDFYSGFYLSKSDDGKLCVARDTLQSRSGANCKITRIRELVEIGD
jgi:hypothetical protein